MKSNNSNGGTSNRNNDNGSSSNGSSSHNNCMQVFAFFTDHALDQRYGMVNFITIYHVLFTMISHVHYLLL